MFRIAALLARIPTELMVSMAKVSRQVELGSQISLAPVVKVR